MGQNNEWCKVERQRWRGRGSERWDVVGGDKGKRKMMEGVSSTSFFVTEIGDQWKANNLFFKFKALGEIDEVVIPPRRDNRGRRFGFMRFYNVKDKYLLSIKLDNLVLDGRKIYANLPRYKRKTKEEVSQGLNLGDKGKVIAASMEGTLHVKKSWVGVNGQKSYVEALHNGTVAEVPIVGSNQRRGVIFKPLHFVPNQEEVNRLNKAFTGALRYPGDEVDIKRKFLEESLFSIKVTILGPNICLLEDLVGEDMESMLLERKDWWDLLFVSIKPWKPSNIDDERLVWIKTYGIPCHARGESLFRSLVDSIGRFVKTDEETKLTSRMDVTRICLGYKGKERVFATIKVVINELPFEVQMV